MPEYLYGSDGRRIEIAGKSKTSIFVGGRGKSSATGAYSVSRKAIEETGQVKTAWGEWLYRDRETALAHGARGRERRQEEAQRRQREDAERNARWDILLRELGLSAPRANVTADELRRLKKEMADAHPDRGGTSDAFIAARERYLEAKTVSVRMRTVHDR